MSATPPDPGLRAYVVLHHTGIDAPHYDLLFEPAPGAPLVSFRLPHWPIVAPTDALPLPEHRRIYLTYEGPISGNRGEVIRVTGGQARLVRTERRWELELVDPPGRLVLERSGAGWRIRAS